VVSHREQLRSAAGVRAPRSDEDPENAVTVELVAIGGSGDSCLEAHGLASLFWIVVPTWPLPRGVLALYEVEALGCGRSTSLGPVQQWML